MCEKMIFSSADNNVSRKIMNKKQKIIVKSLKLVENSHLKAIKNHKIC